MLMESLIRAATYIKRIVPYSTKIKPSCFCIVQYRFKFRFKPNFFGLADNFTKWSVRFIEEYYCFTRQTQGWATWFIYLGRQYGRKWSSSSRRVEGSCKDRKEWSYTCWYIGGTWKIRTIAIQTGLQFSTESGEKTYGTYALSNLNCLNLCESH